MKKKISFIQVHDYTIKSHQYTTSTYINVAKFNNKIYILFNLSTVYYKIMIFISRIRRIVAPNWYLFLTYNTNNNNKNQ